MLTWVDFTRRNDPAQPYYADKLRQLLGKHGYPKVLCFWTKAPATVAYLYRELVSQMQANGTLVLAQVTWNCYHDLEPDVTGERANLRPLVELLGPDAVRLRFDPIIIGYTKADHFQKTLAAAACFGISRITTNFLVPSYKGVGKLLRQRGYDIQEPSRRRKAFTLNWMVEQAEQAGVSIAGCAELYRDGIDDEVPGLVRSGCADPDWATALRPEYAGIFQHRASRPGCLCVYSADWGEYTSRGGPRCPHRCLYCYAK